LLEYVVNPRGKLRFREDISLRMESTLEGFSAVIEPPVGQFRPTRDFQTVVEARAILDPQLEAWRVWAALTEGGDLLPFEFKEATQEAVDVPPDSGHLLAGSSSLLAIGGVATAVERRCTVPAFPRTFVIDDLVRVGFTLYNDAEALPRHTLKIAYAYLTMLEREYGDQAAAARRLGFRNLILSDFKDLSSRGGSLVEARKHVRKTAKRMEFTDDRRGWLLRVFREMLLRQGRTADSVRLLSPFEEVCPGPRSDFRRPAPQTPDSPK
jgi:hypothetical protein